MNRPETGTHGKSATRRRRLLLVVVCVLLVLVVGSLVVWLLGSDGTFSLFQRDGTWARMVDDSKFRVGLDPSFPPFESLDDAGQPVGYDIDLANALAQRWGMRVELVAMGYDSLVDAVMAARVDAVISAMPYDERLTRDLAISPAYFEAGLRLAVPVGSQTIDDVSADLLYGKRIAVEWGSAGDMVARRLLREQSDATPADGRPLMEIVQFDTPDAAMGAVSSGAVDGVLVDAVSLRLAQGRGALLQAVGPVLEANPYVIMSPRRALTLADEIATGLQELRADGTLAAIEARWFGPLPETASSTSP